VILREIPASKILTSSDLSRVSGSRVFEEHLKESIAQIGLVEPLKVVERRGRFLVIDGVMRWNAISSLRVRDPSLFRTVPAYVLPFDKRYELRYQTDIYQDLLPSQLAALVEHLHKQERVSKRDIARYIGVSAPTLRNYTGLWRLIERGGLFKEIVSLMDAGVLPASNPFAWLRLTSRGVRRALESSFTQGRSAEVWIREHVRSSGQPSATRFPSKFVESATGGLPPGHYRQGEMVRALKRDLGLRRRGGMPSDQAREKAAAVRHLSRVIRGSGDPVIQSAAQSLRDFVK
jgi:hypothetical protein